MQINTDAVYKLNVGGSDAVTREEGYLPLCPSKNTLLSIGWMAAGSFGFESSAKATAISKLSAKSSAFPAMLLERCFFWTCQFAGCVFVAGGCRSGGVVTTKSEFYSFESAAATGWKSFLRLKFTRAWGTSSLYRSLRWPLPLVFRLLRRRLAFVRNRGVHRHHNARSHWPSWGVRLWEGRVGERAEPAFETAFLRLLFERTRVVVLMRFSATVVLIVLFWRGTLPVEKKAGNIVINFVINKIRL